MYLHACSLRTIVYQSDSNTASLHISFYLQIGGVQWRFDVSLGRGVVSGSWTAEESQKSSKGTATL